MASLYPTAETLPSFKEGLPNVSQFGWTAVEYSEYKQLIDYVNQVKEYRDEILRLTEGIPDLIDELNALYTNIVELYNDLLVASGEIRDDITEFNIKYYDFTEKYKEVVKLHAEVIDNSKVAQESALAAALSEVNAFNSAASAKVSETESEKYFNQSYELYLALQKGLVYRGTWNPNSGAYPTEPTTNSNWDVVLNEGEEEVMFDGKRWFWGDRLLFLIDSKEYQQIEAGTTVKSVNGKTGAVSLNAHDVNAIANTGDESLTGSLSVIGNGSSIKLKAQIDAAPSYLGGFDSSNNLNWYVGRGDAHDILTLYSPAVGNGINIQTDRVSSTADLYVGGSKVFHKTYPPTAGEVGAYGTSEIDSKFHLLNSLYYADLRNSNFTPQEIPGGRMSTMFSNNGMPTGHFYSVLSSRGWDDAPYRAWQLAGPADRVDAKGLWYRESGKDNANWGSWERVYTQGFKPTPSEIGALPSDSQSITLTGTQPAVALVDTDHGVTYTTFSSNGKYAVDQSGVGQIFIIDKDSANFNVPQINAANVSVNRLTATQANAVSNNGVSLAMEIGADSDPYLSVDFAYRGLWFSRSDKSARVPHDFHSGGGILAPNGNILSGSSLQVKRSTSIGDCGIQMEIHPDGSMDIATTDGTNWFYPIGFNRGSANVNFNGQVNIAGNVNVGNELCLPGVTPSYINWNVNDMFSSGVGWRLGEDPHDGHMKFHVYDSGSYRSNPFTFSHAGIFSATTVQANGINVYGSDVRLVNDGRRHLTFAQSDSTTPDGYFFKDVNGAFIFQHGGPNTGALRIENQGVLRNYDQLRGEGVAGLRVVPEPGGWGAWRARSCALQVDVDNSQHSASQIFKATHWNAYHIAAMDVHVPGGLPGNAIVALHVGGTDNTYGFNGNGNAYAIGGWHIGSDSRFKQNIRSLGDSQTRGDSSWLDKVCALTASSYQYKTDENKDVLGFIAQDVEKVIPEAVTRKTDTTLPEDEQANSERMYLDPMAIIAAQNEAIKELRQMVEELKQTLRGE